jgi:hypothetical protein
MAPATKKAKSSAPPPIQPPAGFVAGAVLVGGSPLQNTPADQTIACTPLPHRCTCDEHLHLKRDRAGDNAQQLPPMVAAMPPLKRIRKKLSESNHDDDEPLMPSVPKATISSPPPKARSSTQKTGCAAKAKKSCPPKAPAPLVQQPCIAAQSHPDAETAPMSPTEATRAHRVLVRVSANTRITFVQKKSAQLRLTHHTPCTRHCVVDSIPEQTAASETGAVADPSRNTMSASCRQRLVATTCRRLAAPLLLTIYCFLRVCQVSRRIVGTELCGHRKLTTIMPFQT